LPSSEGQKIACSPSFVDYRPQNKWSNVIGHGSHTKGRTRMRQRKERKPKTWMWLMSSLLRSEYNNLQLAEATMGRGPGNSEEVW
jgi:hypothetical protein